MASINESVVWVDHGGNQTIKLIRQSNFTQTIRNDLVAISNADWLQSWSGTLAINGTIVTANATYPSVLQQATLVFLCADNTQARIDLPAPVGSIFLPDGVTVDSTAIATLIGDAIGNLQSASGSLATAYLSGILNRNR